MNISAVRLEALKEIGNIGSGHAATALSKLLDARINMAVPKVWLVALGELYEALGDYDIPQVALYLQVEGQAPGKAIFILPIGSASYIAQHLLRYPERPDIFSDEMAQSALREVGNIVVSSFVIALSEISGINLHPSVPALAIDMGGAIIDAVLLEEGMIDDNVLIIDTKLTGVEEVEGKFFYIPNEGSLDKLLGVFGI